MIDPPRRRDDLHLAELPEGDVVVSLGDGSKALVLNAMGAAVLELCDGTHTAEQIVRMLAEAFSEIEPARIAHDVETLLAQLEHEGALH